MTTNTVRHVSDESIYKIFKPAGTAFPANITNVQAALAALSPQAVNGIPNASQTVIGISRFATQIEVDSGLLSDVAVSPVTLKSAITRPQATTTVVGLTRYSTDAETVAGVISNAAVVPSSLKAALNATTTAIFARQATELATGVAKISTNAAAIAGLDDTTIMTPKKTLAAINNATAKIPSPATATTTVEGTVRIALAGEVASGTLNNGVAVSPLGLASLTSTTARRGLIQLATAGEVAARTVTDKAISPSTLGSYTGGVGRIGLLKTITTAGSGGDATTALAWNADVLNLRGGQTVAGNTTFSGRVNAGSLFISGQQAVTVNMLTDDVPVGVSMLWFGDANKVPAKWRILDGSYSYTAQSNPALWAAMGGRFPDMRGMFPRGVGTSQHILNARANDSKGKAGLGVGCDGPAVPGGVQAQQVRYHKHESGWGEHHQRPEARNGCTVRNGYVGSNKTDYDNYKWFTNEGYEVEAENIRDSFGTMNSQNLIGNENRPWSMGVYFIMKIQ